MGTHKIYSGIQGIRDNISGSLYGDCHELLAQRSNIFVQHRICHAQHGVAERSNIKSHLNATIREAALTVNPSSSVPTRCWSKMFDRLVGIVGALKTNRNTNQQLHLLFLFSADLY